MLAEEHTGALPKSPKRRSSLCALDRGEIQPGKDMVGGRLTDFALTNGATKSLLLQFDMDSSVTYEG